MIRKQLGSDLPALPDVAGMVRGLASKQELAQLVQRLEQAQAHTEQQGRTMEAAFQLTQQREEQLRADLAQACEQVGALQQTLAQAHDRMGHLSAAYHEQQKALEQQTQLLDRVAQHCDTQQDQIAAVARQLDALLQPHTTWAPVRSPTFEGTPTAPTPEPANSSRQLATTEFVQRLTKDHEQRLVLLETNLSSIAKRLSLTLVLK